jgi:pSer/pThr/pTyr-binding forkhead associated (FHA) protein
MASLTITQSPGGQVGKHFIVKHRPLAGGRHPSQEIQLLDAEVSRRHFLVRIEGGDHVITESQGANGLFVNGQKVKEHKLQDGDEIRAGTTVLVYSKHDEGEQTDEVQHQRRADRRVREGVTVLHDPAIPPSKPATS